MVELLNGAGKSEPLEGWMIAMAAGRSFIGKPVKAPPGVAGFLILNPVYDLQAQMIQQGNQTGIVHLALPVLCLSSLKTLDLSTSAPIVIQCDELSPNERKALAGAVLRCDDMLRSMRAADAGIAVAPAGVKLPPMRRS